MKEFRGFVIKEFYHIFRDKRTMLVLFGMPLAMMLLFGFVITNEIKDVNIAVLDHSKDEVTRDITSRLVSSGYFKLYDNLIDDSEIGKVFRRGIVKEVVIFEPGFGRKLEKERQANIQILADASDANFANLITNYTSAIIRNYVSETNHQQVLPYQIDPEIRMVYNPELKRGLSLCAWHHGNDIDAYFGTNDFGIDCPRKRAGNYGSFAGFPIKTITDYNWKSNAIRCNVVYKCNNHRTSGLLGV